MYVKLEIPEMDDVLAEMETARKQFDELYCTLERIAHKTLEVQAKLNESASE